MFGSTPFVCFGPRGHVVIHHRRHHGDTVYDASPWAALALLAVSWGCFLLHHLHLLQTNIPCLCRMLTAAFLVHSCSARRITQNQSRKDNRVIVPATALCWSLQKLLSEP